MAYISLKDVFATKSFYDGKGLEVEERFTKRDGTEGTSKYSVFFNEPHGISDGSKITKLGGIAGVRARIWPREDGDDVAMATITINNPTIEGVSGAVPQSDPFPGNDESPF